MMPSLMVAEVNYDISSELLTIPIVEICLQCKLYILGIFVREKEDERN